MRTVCAFVLLVWLTPSAAGQVGQEGSVEAIQISNPCGNSLGPPPLLYVVDSVMVEFGPARHSRSLRSEDVVGARVLKREEVVRRYGLAGYSGAYGGVVEITMRDAPPRPAPASNPASFPDSVEAGSPITLHVDPLGPSRTEVFDDKGCRVLAVTGAPGSSTLYVPTFSLAPGTYVVRTGGAVSRRVTVR